MDYLAFQSMSIGCDLFDAIDTRLKSFIPNHSFIGKAAIGLGGRIISAGATFALPMYLYTNNVLNNYPLLNYFNPILSNRMFYSTLHNGVNASSHLVASCYNVIKGDNNRALKHAQIASKFFWRGAIDASLLYFFPSAIQGLAVTEAAYNIIAPNNLRENLNFITKSIDNGIDKVYDVLIPKGDRQVNIIPKDSDNVLIPPIPSQIISAGSSREESNSEVSESLDDEFFDNTNGGEDYSGEELAPRGSAPFDDSDNEQIRVFEELVSEDSSDVDTVFGTVTTDLDLNIPFEQLDKKQLFERTYHDSLYPKLNRYNPITTSNALNHLKNGQQVYCIDKYAKHYPYNWAISNIPNREDYDSAISSSGSSSFDVRDSEQIRISEDPVPGDPVRFVAAAVVDAAAFTGLILKIPFELVSKKQLFVQTSHNPRHPTLNCYSKIFTLEAISRLMNGQQVYYKDNYGKHYPYNWAISKISLEKNQRLRKKRW